MRQLLKGDPAVSDFGIAGLSVLVGIFTNEIAQKLRDFMDSVFLLNTTIGIEGLEKHVSMKSESISIASTIVQREFEMALQNIQIENLKFLSEQEQFKKWCLKVKKEPNQVVFDISSVINGYMAQYIKSYYSKRFFHSLRNLIKDIGKKNSEKNSQVPYVYLDVKFRLEPIDTYTELSRGYEIRKFGETKLTFLTETYVNANRIEIYPSEEETTSILDGVKVTLNLLITGLKSPTFSEPFETPIMLASREFVIDNLRLSDYERRANVWLKNHVPTDPLIATRPYDLIINVGGRHPNTDYLEETEQNAKKDFESEGTEITVSLEGEGFSIPTNTKKLFLPKEADSNPISFEIMPKVTGVRSMRVLFFHKLEPLVILSGTSKSGRSIIF